MCLVFAAGALLYQSSQKQIKLCMFEITSDARIWFQMASWATCRWLSGTNNWVWAHVGDVIIVWRNTHNNTEPDAIWFPAMLTDTVLNIQGIRVKYRTNGNCNILATESRPWESKWYHLFSAQVCMLRRGAFGFFYTTIFNWTFKNCVSRRGSSKGYREPWKLKVPKESSKINNTEFYQALKKCYNSKGKEITWKIFFNIQKEK